jgi:hypothetical protein
VEGQGHKTLGGYNPHRVALRPGCILILGVAPGNSLEPAGLSSNQRGHQISVKPFLIKKLRLGYPNRTAS